MDDYIHDIGTFPVKVEDLRKFAYHYNQDLDAFKGHEIMDHEINGVKHNIPVPPAVASKIALSFMRDHPVMLYQMLQKSYRERTAPNKMGKFVPKTVHQKLCMVFELALETHKVAKTRCASAYARRTFRN